MQLDGKNVIVTGGDRGIGREGSFALAKKGVNATINFYKDENKARETLEELGKSGDLSGKSR